MTGSTRLLAGRYEVGELIGRGGMAEVHAGYDVRLGREVAVKILRSELARDPSFLMRFRREAQSAASLNHPAVVAVFDSGEDAVIESGGADVALPFIVMEFVHGRTLRDILHEDGPLEPLRAARIMAQVLRALDYSHQHGIVHRDIKPANVMIGPGDEAKVMDFGIARAIADTAATMTNTSVVVGTAQYLSPEQAQGHDIDARSDLYSAGCLLYELLTGRPPFVGDSPVAIAYQHVGEPPQPPSVYATGVPSNLDLVVLHALAKDPEKRYQTGEEFAEDLDAVLRREPTAAAAQAVAAGELTPPRPPEPSPTPAPRRRTPRYLIPAIIGVLAVAAIVVGLLAGRGAFNRDPDPVAVPSVIGRSEAEAKQAIAAAGLMFGPERVTNQAQAGTVVSQEPKGGEPLPPNSLVRVGISTGPGQATVPNLRNFDQATASRALEDAKFVLAGVDRVDSKDVSEGQVVGTDPKAGTKLSEGAPVKLLVSSGLVTVPDVTGDALQDAIAKLNKAGLGRKLTYVQGSKKPGTVTSQSYAKGEKIKAGTEVELTVVQEPIPTRTKTVTVSPSTTTPPSPPAPTPSTQPTPDPTSTDGPLLPGP